VNEATIKPESYGVINKIAKMLTKHVDLNFSIEGHTDSDGDADYNQALSLQREGLGESVPLNDNASAEAKANNRRVEFVKL